MAALPAAAKENNGPSRRPSKGCAWEKLSDRSIGLDAWVERCNYGSRKIDFLFVKSSLAIRYSDGGAPEPVVDVIDLLPGETPENGAERFFRAHTEKPVAARCVMAPYREGKHPAGVRRLTFVPGPAYAKELAEKAEPDEVPDPPCGDWGAAPDGIQYFETHPASMARRILFVRVGQDVPLFDEQTLTLVPSP